MNYNQRWIVVQWWWMIILNNITTDLNQPGHVYCWFYSKNDRGRLKNDTPKEYPKTWKTIGDVQKNLWIHIKQIILTPPHNVSAPQCSCDQNREGSGPPEDFADSPSHFKDIPLRPLTQNQTPQTQPQATNTSTATSSNSQQQESSTSSSSQQQESQQGESQQQESISSSSSKQQESSSSENQRQGQQWGRGRFWLGGEQNGQSSIERDIDREKSSRIERGGETSTYRYR